MIVIRPLVALLFWAAFAAMLAAWGLMLITAQVTGFLGRLAGYDVAGPSAPPVPPVKGTHL